MTTEKQIARELDKVVERRFPSDTEMGRVIRAIYAQNPLLNLLFKAAEQVRRDGKSPYTQPVLKVIHGDKE